MDIIDYKPGVFAGVSLFSYYFFCGVVLEFLGGFTGTGVTLLALIEGVLFLLFPVSTVANLVIQAFMLIDFFKVKKAIDGMTIQDC